jgi:hypothetical protein
VIDDSPSRNSWPPTHEGSLDRVRLHWLEHPDLMAKEISDGSGIVSA